MLLRSIVAVLLAVAVFGGSAPAAAGPEADLAGAWDFHMVRGKSASPRVCQATLEFHRSPDGWTGVLRFRRFLGHKILRLEDLEVLREEFTARVSTRRVRFTMRGEIAGGVLDGSADFGGADYASDDWFRWTACRPGSFFEPGVKSHANRLRGRAGQYRMDEDALRALVIEARDAASDALVIMKKGRVIVDRSFGFPRDAVPLQELTRFVTGLGVARLLGEGKIASLDEPLSTWYPEWSDGPRAKMTLRHLLSHTTGIPSRGLPTADSDGVMRALALEPRKDLPGAAHAPNPTLLPLLAGLFPRTVGSAADVYLAKALHRPLRIEGWAWERDAAGTTRAGTGLAMTSGDLARLGRLVVDEGVVGKKTLVAARWLREFARPATEHQKDQGLLWTLLRDEKGEVEGIHMRGWLGQALVIIPSRQLVAVRLRRSRDAKDDGTDDYDLTRFLDLLRAALK